MMAPRHTFAGHGLLQIFPEPTKYMLQTLNAQLRVTTTRQPMALAFETYKKYFAPKIFEGSKELFRLFDTTAQILLAMNNK